MEPDAAADTAEKLIHRRDSPSDARDRVLRSLSSSSSPNRLRSPSSPSASEAAAMARLEDEFRNILLSRATPLDPSSDSLLSELSSLSLSLSLSSSVDVDAAEDADVDAEPDASPDPLLLARSSTGCMSTSSSSSSRRSTSSIREVELLPPDASHDLRSIAERMIASGYSRECFQAYSSVRKAAVDLSLRHLGVEKLSIGDVQRLPWESLEGKIRRWIRSAKACVRVVFASERRLHDTVFLGLLDDPSSDGPFAETVKGAALQLFGFAEAIAIGRRSPEKLFKILDLHDALAGLLPDVSAVFGGDSSPVPSQVSETLSRLAEAARGVLSEFESAVHNELARTPVPGGTVHPLTRYVMNYISLISDYTPTLSHLIVSKPPIAKALGDTTMPIDDALAPLPEISLEDLENDSPLAVHLIWIIAVLDQNLEWKSKLYKDPALGHVFVMNNAHYIVHKVKADGGLRGLIGDGYLKSLTRRFQQAATSYLREAWGRVLGCLRDEGLHAGGSFSSGVSKGALRDRFKAFNAAFDEVHRMQAVWSVPDPQLREELRISVSEKLLPAYRSFLGRYRHHIESGRHPEVYIKYSVEDLESALADFFEGTSLSQGVRRRSH